MAPVQYHYGKFPPRTLNLEKIFPFIEPATLALGDYRGLLDAMPNAAVLLSPLITQEAVLSSKIEGTQATLGEVLQFEAGADEKEFAVEKRNDIEEILNYRRALNEATQALSTLPLCGRLLKQAHATLMAGVRGADKTPGKFKLHPNAIGPPGCTEETAKFLPIAPDQLEDGLATWEKYTHSTQPNQLVQLAIIHAEFEALHPFQDGNGRLGRMLVPLFLVERKILGLPAFYISAFFEAHREEYYERLIAVSRDDDWTGWCAFFLKAVAEQARQNNQKARAILELYEKRKAWIVELTHSPYAIAALDFIFKNPVFGSDQFWKQAAIPNQTALNLLRKIRGDLLVTLRAHSGRRPARYAYMELIQVAEGEKLEDLESDSAKQKLMS